MSGWRTPNLNTAFIMDVLRKNKKNCWTCENMRIAEFPSRKCSVGKENYVWADGTGHENCSDYKLREDLKDGAKSN